MDVTLRPLRPGDEEAFVVWGADDVFCRASGWTAGLPAQRLREHWRAEIDHPRSDLLQLAVEVGGRIVGHVDLAHLTSESAELGVAVGERSLWGQGVGRRGSELMLAHGFNDLSLHRIDALVHTPNLRSHALMARLGFRVVGEGDPEAYDGEVVAVVRYELSAAEWHTGLVP